jgi:Ca2+-binding RTX toxin-like protein
MADILGTIFDDTLEGDTSGTILKGMKGDDDLYAGSGGMILYGGEDEDYLSSWAATGLVKLYGDGGNDDLAGGMGNDQLYGGEGNDWFILSEGSDSIFGGNGVDTLSLSSFMTGNITYTLGLGGSGSLKVRSGTTTYSSIEGLAGGSGNDKLTGNASSNTLEGFEGKDTLRGMEGDDVLWGGEGHDLLFGGAGADLFVFEGASQRRDVATSSDQIGDFDPVADGLVFWSRNFTSMTATGSGVTIGGTKLFSLDTSQFAAQTTKVAPNLATRVIYDTDDGLVYYDADGALSGYRPVLIAQVGAGLALTAADIFLI